MMRSRHLRSVFTCLCILLPIASLSPYNDDYSSYSQEAHSMSNSSLDDSLEEYDNNWDGVLDSSELDESDSFNSSDIEDDREEEPEINNYARRRRARKTRVKMPNGADMFLDSPQVRGGRCRKEARLIRLPKRSMEYNMVINQLESTKIDIPNCEKRGGCVKKFRVFQITKIINDCLWSLYQSRRSDIKHENGPTKEYMLFYGTRSPKKIANRGFDERYSSTKKKAFGAGLYFVRHSNAANENAFGPVPSACPKHRDVACTKCKRRMLLGRVTLGKQNELNDNKVLAHAPVGFHSVLGKQRSNPFHEYVVYKGEQAYPQYIISYVIRT